MKYLIIFTVLFLFSVPAQSDFYFELGIGVDIYPQTEQLPEVNLQSPLGKYILGFEAQHNWSVEFEHISSIPQKEEGRSINVLWFTKRVHF